MEVLRELALFAGAGGGILGGHLLGWRTVAAVEIDPYCLEVLLRRQLDGCLPRIPIWDDVKTFDGRPWRGLVDVVSGGFPCQDISCAGKGVGLDGDRSGLWSEFARVICEVRPRFAFVENSPMLTSRGLGRVLGDLAEMGFDAKWGVLGADDAGAPHHRKRIWIAANSNNRRFADVSKLHRESAGEQSAPRWDNVDGFCSHVSDSDGFGHGNICESVGKQGSRIAPIAGRDGEKESMADSDLRRGRESEQIGAMEGRRSSVNSGEWWTTEPGLGRVVNGVANWVDRIRSIGNGQVPAVARLAWEVLRSDR